MSLVETRPLSAIRMKHKIKKTLSLCENVKKYLDFGLKFSRPRPRSIANTLELKVSNDKRGQSPP